MSKYEKAELEVLRSAARVFKKLYSSADAQEAIHSGALPDYMYIYYCTIIAEEIRENSEKSDMGKQLELELK